MPDDDELTAENECLRADLDGLAAENVRLTERNARLENLAMTARDLRAQNVYALNPDRPVWRRFADAVCALDSA